MSNSPSSISQAFSSSGRPLAMNKKAVAQRERNKRRKDEKEAKRASREAQRAKRAKDKAKTAAPSDPAPRVSIAEGSTVEEIEVPEVCDRQPEEAYTDPGDSVRMYDTSWRGQSHPKTVMSHAGSSQPSRQAYWSKNVRFIVRLRPTISPSTT